MTVNIGNIRPVYGMSILSTGLLSFFLSDRSFLEHILKDKEPMARKRETGRSLGVGAERDRDSAQGVGAGAIDLDAAWISRVRQRLVAWYAVEHRDLPWRASRNPYHILVSEMMLV